MAHPPCAAAQEAARKRLQYADALSASEHLLALREATGLTQDRLGKLLGGAGPNVCDWEKRDTGGPREGKTPVLPTAHKIEAWSRGVVKRLRLPKSAVLLAIKWCSEQDRQDAKALTSWPEVSP